MFRLNKKGQNTAEYAVLLAIVIGAVVAMQTYVKRSWQGGVKFAVDNLKSGDSGKGQYEPYYSESDSTTTTSATSADTEQTFDKASGDAGRVDRVMGDRSTVRGGTQTVLDASTAD